MKTLLVLGVGRSNIPAIQQMSSVARVIAVDRKPFQILESSSLNTLTLDFADHEAILNLVRQQAIDGVYPFSDHAIRPAAIVTKLLRLVGLHGNVAENFLDKSKMREIWRQKGLTQPEFCIVNNVHEALEAANKIGYPVIIKPASSGGGGRGVFRVETDYELQTYFSQSIEHNRYSDKTVVEKFIHGTESSLEIVIFEGNGYLIALSTKKKPKARSQVATEISYPGELQAEIVEEIRTLCTDAAYALGIQTGVAHFEVITTTDGIPYLIEVGGRVGGGHTFHPIASHVSGINYPKLVAYLYTGCYDEVRRLLTLGINSRGAVYSFPVSKISGKIKSISFSNTGQNSTIELWKHAGDVVSQMSSSMDRLGCVITLAADREKAIAENSAVMSGFSLNLEREPR